MRIPGWAKIVLLGLVRSRYLVYLEGCISWLWLFVIHGRQWVPTIEFLQAFYLSLNSRECTHCPRIQVWIRCFEPLPCMFGQQYPHKHLFFWIFLWGRACFTATVIRSPGRAVLDFPLLRIRIHWTWRAPELSATVSRDWSWIMVTYVLFVKQSYVWLL